VRLVIATCLALTLCAVGLLSFRQRPVDCALVIEHPDPLDVQRASDRARLASEAASIRDTAARYRAYVATIPLASDGVHARETIAGRPERAYRYCLAILTDSVARAHHLDAATVESFVVDQAGHASAVRQ